MRVFLILALLLTPLRAYDPQLEGPGLTVDLISENRSVSEGQPFTVGLHLHHYAGFHTYWKNPGMVGVATSIDWNLPPGFQASAISWPSPQKTYMSDYPCHGYERDVTLLVTITPPKKIKTTTVTLTAKTVWMCCAKGCFPGYQTFHMTLPVTSEPKSDPTAKALIEKARTEIPEPDHTIKATLLSSVNAPIIQILIEGMKKNSEDSLYFFSTDRQISSDKKQDFSYRDDGTLLLTASRSEFSPKDCTTLPGVLKIDQRQISLEAVSKN